MAGVVADEMEVVEEHGAAASKGGETPAVAALATPWVEKYRPETLGDVIAHTDIVSTRECPPARSSAAAAPPQRRFPAPLPCAALPHRPPLSPGPSIVHKLLHNIAQ